MEGPVRCVLESVQPAARLAVSRLLAKPVLEEFEPALSGSDQPAGWAHPPTYLMTQMQPFRPCSTFFDTGSNVRPCFCDFSRNAKCQRVCGFTACFDNALNSGSRDIGNSRRASLHIRRSHN